MDVENCHGLIGNFSFKKTTFIITLQIAINQIVSCLAGITTWLIAVGDIIMIMFSSSPYFKHLFVDFLQILKWSLAIYTSRLWKQKLTSATRSGGGFYWKYDSNNTDHTKLAMLSSMLCTVKGLGSIAEFYISVLILLHCWVNEL